MCKLGNYYATWLAAIEKFVYVMVMLLEHYVRYNVFYANL